MCFLGHISWKVGKMKILRLLEPGAWYHTVSGNTTKVILLQHLVDIDTFVAKTLPCVVIRLFLSHQQSRLQTAEQDNQG